ncbi:MATE family efflux transporter [Nocardia terpenica]|uniref:MATE family efflux transporter n=1 Tax=Nocardia terpenica TaxID=455432 RepID=UPI001893224A|nr:MATE family efflux transporter [Nocardia terpenica]MBF6065327.1 MATE family efflux transporter [Nocardia terpenica]MBF6108054.1 MATE family efflux transporter [Nocardia terpenica]MBF6115415.1 MATE family efflux transporter [Nocardia terpenica]MBF6121852.1 MATE family efflux transporter [Nocardia terpenica]MBF6155604.1 MATE family efflux transporter [Nocardia terpenica]
MTADAVTGTATEGDDPASAGPWRILAIAVPTLGVLVAEPIYLLFDMAVVGRLGALALAGLAVGGLILSQVGTQLTFLSYGTTARSSRRHGAGDRAGAVAEGVQASWIAVGAGVLIVVVLQVFAGPVARVLAGGPDIADEALRWIRIALFGVPLILLTLAGNGWLRGVQQTRRPLAYVIAGLGVSAILCPVLVHGLLGAPRMELAGSAVANLVGQVVSAALFLNALIRQGVSLAPDPTAIRAQLVLGRDLIVRSAAFQVCALSAGAVAARFGAASVGAHQLVLQLWYFVALTLDALAIAAQTLVGATLGAGDAPGAQRLARRVTVWSTLFSVLLALVFAAGVGVIPALFTGDPHVLDRMHAVWWFFVLLFPTGGVVFALDGVLLGAGDAAYLRNITMGSALLGFLPLIWLSLAFGWGIAGIWSGLAAFMVLRLVGVGARALSGRWARVGAEVPRGVG